MFIPFRQLMSLGSWYFSFGFNPVTFHESLCLENLRIIQSIYLLIRRHNSLLSSMILKLMFFRILHTVGSSLLWSTESGIRYSLIISRLMWLIILLILSSDLFLLYLTFSDGNIKILVKYPYWCRVYSYLLWAIVYQLLNIWQVLFNRLIDLERQYPQLVVKNHWKFQEVFSSG